MARRDKTPRKADELTRRRALKQPPVDWVGPETTSAEWLRKRGLIWTVRQTIPNDTELRDMEWGKANKCAIMREGPTLTYVSFAHHKIVKMPNPLWHGR